MRTLLRNRFAMYLWRLEEARKARPNEEEKRRWKSICKSHQATHITQWPGAQHLYVPIYVSADKFRSDITTGFRLVTYTKPIDTFGLRL
jgi:hypothetical protein